MNILFITSTRIGDAIMSTGLLDHILRTWPEGKVTIVCGPLCTPLFQGFPNLDAVVPLRKKSFNLHWLDLWLKLRGRRWDVIVDLRDSAVSRVLPSGLKFIHGSYVDKSLPKVEQNASVMGLDAAHAPLPRLWFSGEQIAAARTLIPEGGPVLGIGPTSNWRAKTWPAENFAALALRLTGPDGPVPGARVAVFGGPGEEGAVAPVLEALPPERLVDLVGKADLGTATAALSLCTLFVGNDSGIMHSAAAAGTPTLGLYGPSDPLIYGPRGALTAWVRTPESVEELTGYEGFTPDAAPCLMTSLRVETVAEKASELLQTARRSLGRSA